MSKMNPKELARLLLEAGEKVVPLGPELAPDFATEEDAYAVQVEVRDEKIRRGCRVVGKKIGFTGKAMRQQFGLKRPDYGNVFSDQVFPQGTPIAVDNFFNPKVEGEIAFILKSDLRGPGVTVSEVVQATQGVMACLEFVDTRWDMARMKFDIRHSIADNAACGGILLGSRLVPLEGLDLRYLAMFVEKNGELVSSGAGVEVMGDPANAVAWLANAMAEHGNYLKAGEVILSGAITGATPVQAGDSMQVSFSQLGSISVKFV